MELILTWVIKAEHTGALSGNPSFDWIKENYNFVHQLPAPSAPEGGTLYLLLS